MSFQLINFHYFVPGLKKYLMWVFWPHKPDVGITLCSFMEGWRTAVFSYYYGSLLLDYNLCLANAHFLHSHRFQSIFLICSPSLNPVLKGFCLCFLSPTGCSGQFSKWRQAPHWTQAALDIQVSSCGLRCVRTIISISQEKRKLHHHSFFVVVLSKYFQVTGHGTKQ